MLWRRLNAQHSNAHSNAFAFVNKPACTDCVNAISMSMFEYKSDKHLVRAGYT